MGMKSLTQGQFAREKADTLSCVFSFVDPSHGSDTVDMFLVTRRWQIAPYVHRYPSPVGRLGHTPCQAPDFFRSRSVVSLQRRGSAQIARNRVSGWNHRSIRDVCCAQARTFKGAETWTFENHPFHARSRSARFWRSRPAAKLSASKRSAVASLAQELRRLPMATWRRAQPSGQLQTSPIAKLIRNAADAPAQTAVSHLATVEAPRLGGLFYAIAAALSAGQEKTDGKGHPCSTRS
ncbi:hypothetical protein SAMN05443551_1860 [Marivita hallyeonensis]|uniref:Uncharacterized protein n=1 Tax=Marivita hallyeonensis TaxID=996342 RepID=A0A1M5RRX3_9RHOB|nr:hypothetical protein SAMN05443551_1860 [Marivita hallyeonensis]